MGLKDQIKKIVNSNLERWDQVQKLVDLGLSQKEIQEAFNE